MLCRLALKRVSLNKPYLWLNCLDVSPTLTRPIDFLKRKRFPARSIVGVYMLFQPLLLYIFEEPKGKTIALH